MNGVKKKFKNIRIVMSIMVFIFIAFLSSIIIYTSILNNIKTTQLSTIKQIKTERFDQIYMYIEELRKQSYVETKEVSTNIEYAIRNQCDLNVLKEDLDNGVYSNTLSDIFHYYISDKFLNNIDNSRNGMLIATNQGIIEDLNYSRAEDSDSFRDWNVEINRSYNKALTKDAIEKIKFRSNSIIALEQIDNTNNPNHINVHELTYSTLLEVYLNEGMNGLRNYQILTPFYITKDGDVFGQQDIVQGNIQYNHKFIIIQEFNLYDQIELNYPEIIKSNDIEVIEVHYKQTMNQMYMLGLLFIVSILCTLFYLVYMYNYMVKNDIFKN